MINVISKNWMLDVNLVQAGIKEEVKKVIKVLTMLIKVSWPQSGFLIPNFQ